MPFLSVLFICTICCETNTLCYERLRKKWSLSLEPILTILRQMGVSLLVCTLVFGTLVYSLNYLLYGHVAGITSFLSSLFIALLIISVETLVYIVRDFKRAQQAMKETQQPVTWQYRSGSRIHMVSVENIAYVFSQKGLVYVVSIAGEKHLTQYNSLNGLAEENDTSAFFRLNRQFMVSVAAISSVEKEVNQKLRVRLSPQLQALPTEAMVSRYTSPEFKRWLQSH